MKALDEYIQVVHCFYHWSSSFSFIFRIFGRARKHGGEREDRRVGQQVLSSYVLLRSTLLYWPGFVELFQAKAIALAAKNGKLSSTWTVLVSHWVGFVWWPSFGWLADRIRKGQYQTVSSSTYSALTTSLHAFFLSCVLGENRKIFHEQECEKTLITLLSAEVSKHCFVS